MLSLKAGCVLHKIKGVMFQTQLIHTFLGYIASKTVHEIYPKRKENNLRAESPCDLCICVQLAIELALGLQLGNSEWLRFEGIILLFSPADRHTK